MKFICQSCSREFDFGAPRGMQLPCPACGGSLVDEETASGAPLEEDPQAVLNAPTLFGAPPMPELQPAPVAEGEYAPEEGAFAEPAAEDNASYDNVALDGYAEDEYSQEAESEAMGEGVYTAEGGNGLLFTGWILFAVMFSGLAVTVFMLVANREQMASAGGLQRECDSAKRSLLKSDAAVKKLTERLDTNKESLNKFVKENTQLKKELGEITGSFKNTDSRSALLEKDLAASRKILTEKEAELAQLRNETELARTELATFTNTLTASLRAMRAVDSMARPGRLAVALGHLNSSIAASDTFAEAYWMRAKVFMKLHKGEEALRDFLRVDELTRKNTGLGHIRALIGAGDVCRRLLAKPARAIEFYDRAAKLAPDSPAAQLAEARSKALSRRTTKALNLASESLAVAQKGGEDAVGLRLVKVEMLALNETTRRTAIQEAEVLLADDPNNVEALDIRGRLLLEEDMAAYAIDDLQRAMKLDPLGVERLIPLGKALVDNERYSHAVEILKRAIENDGSSIEAKLMLGKAYVELQRFDEAKRILTMVINADGDSVEAFRLRGRAQVGNKDYAAGIGDFERAVRKGDLESRKLIAKVYVKDGDVQYRNPTRAITQISVVIKANPNDAEAYSILAMAHASRNEKAKAIVAMRKAVSLSPTKELYRQLLSDYERQ